MTDFSNMGYRQNIQDSVFRKLFSTKENILNLYRTLHPEDKDTTADDIEILTLENILVNGLYNDLGFAAGKRFIILLEAQSRLTGLTILRLWIYLALTIERYLERNNLLDHVYSYDSIDLPIPEVYIVYTGTEKDIPKEFSLGMDVFGQKICAELIAPIIQYDPDKDDLIFQYMRFCSIYHEVHDRYTRSKPDRRLTRGEKQAIIEEVLDLCRNENVLTEFLAQYAGEVRKLLMTLISQEEYDRLHEKRMRQEAQDALERAIVETTIRVTDEVTAEVTAEVTEKVTKQVTRQVTAEVQQDTTVNNLRSLMRASDLSFDKAADILNIEGDLREYCRNQLS